MTGLVTLDGNKLSSGVIRFIPTGSVQGPAASTSINAGIYEFSTLDGPITGTHRIEIEATDYLGFDIDDEVAFATTVQQGKTLPKNPIPEIYNRQSTLTAGVTPEGSRELNFELTPNAATSAVR